MVSPPLGPQRLGVIGAGYFRGAGPNDGVSLRSWKASARSEPPQSYLICIKQLEATTPTSPP